MIPPIKGLRDEDMGINFKVGNTSSYYGLPTFLGCDVCMIMEATINNLCTHCKHDQEEFEATYAEMWVRRGLQDLDLNEPPKEALLKSSSSATTSMMMMSRSLTQLCIIM